MSDVRLLTPEEEAERAKADQARRERQRQTDRQAQNLVNRFGYRDIKASLPNGELLLQTKDKDRLDALVREMTKDNRCRLDMTDEDEGYHFAWLVFETK